MRPSCTASIALGDLQQLADGLFRSGERLVIRMSHANKI
jgi:hypothetical protein